MMIDNKLESKTSVIVLIKSDHKPWLAIKERPMKVNKGKAIFLPETKMARIVTTAIINQNGTAVKAPVIPFINTVPDF